MQSTTIQSADRATVVVPCYNEQDRLDLEAFRTYLANNDSVAFLFVDDGSTDDTRARIQELQATSPGRVEVLVLDTNRGKAEAVRMGVMHAMMTGVTYVGYWDADLATPLEEIGRMMDRLAQRHDIIAVFGSRVRLLGTDIQRAPLRHYLGRIFATLASVVVGLAIYDTQCGAKMFRNIESVRRVFTQPFLTSWIFDVEILARLQNLVVGGATIENATQVVELPLQRWRDVDGSKLRFRHMLRAVVDLGTLAWKYRRAGSSRRAAKSALRHNG